jgi:hypothetical protein
MIPSPTGHFEACPLAAGSLVSVDKYENAKMEYLHHTFLCLNSNSPKDGPEGGADSNQCG